MIPIVYFILCFFIDRKSEKSASIVRDDSFTNIANASNAATVYKRLASAPPENNPTPSSTINQRRSRLDTNANSSHDNLPSVTSTDDDLIPDVMSNSVSATTNGSGMGVPKNRFFSLSRRFRFRGQSSDKETPPPTTPSPATVHFLDEDIDLETKERTTRRSEQNGSRPSKGILKSLRHRSPFRFRSKDAVIPEQEPSPPPPPIPEPIPPRAPVASVPTTTAPKETRSKLPPPAPTSTQTKHRGRLVELRKTTPKSSSSNGTSKKSGNTPTPTTTEPAPSGSTLVRRASGLKDLIHKFEVTPSDRSSKTKRTSVDGNTSNAPSTETNQDEKNRKGTNQSDPSNHDQQGVPQVNSTNRTKAADIPDLLRNVAKDPMITTTTITNTTVTNKNVLRHSNSSRQTASFDSTTSMVSASESILTTSSSTRRPTSTARPLMISLVS